MTFRRVDGCPTSVNVSGVAVPIGGRYNAVVWGISQERHAQPSLNSHKPHADLSPGLHSVTESFSKRV
ncbi:hypothetical protein K437DRAFT_189881 [Tilletiaria anomala UBC 951]|uniref:Uncharacterized protein n=1 Tax=Tilletiaria anomala (strain ATCC 24038 / CBS 436.72 / UBC 951) TaxID=1037660 RepID=A0A066VP72_TILAU|nr:uncharacterized protein K437DRAFT_189881 [Tilletiaria anomala UBC 951]KDN40335.1 hypothetical protein K437DRAFT_189881 [Tilletiaria anomala UBC 951]